MVIAIDGPAGAGKSEISRRIASELGIKYLDTGAMYRAIALRAIESDTPLDDGEALAKMLQHTSMDLISEVGKPSALIVDGRDVTGLIRTPQVSDGSSRVSVHAQVRQWLLERQRAIAADGDAVMDGRDIGTVVMPNAEVKIYLTASPEVRARRRVAQLLAAGEDADYAMVLNEVVRRDKRDMNREVSPLRRADDAALVDSSEMSIDDVVSAILDIVNDYRRGMKA